MPELPVVGAGGWIVAMGRQGSLGKSDVFY